MSDRKKKLIRIFIIVGTVLVLLFAATLVLGWITRGYNTPTLDYEFYVPAEDEDYFNDPEYLAKDRYLHYTDDMGQMTVMTENIKTRDIGPALFKLYFLYLEQGDAEGLNSLYSDGYIEENGSFEDFTPQRVYAKELKYLYEEKIDDSTYSVTFSLDYNIMKNDGSFRRDIGSDMSRTQTVTVHYTNEDAKIVKVVSEYRK